MPYVLSIILLKTVHEEELNHAYTQVPTSNVNPPKSGSFNNEVERLEDFSGSLLFIFVFERVREEKPINECQSKLRSSWKELK